MKLLASIAFSLIVAYIALVVVINNLSFGPAACSQEFTLPAMACRFGALGITLLLVPASGLLAFFAARKVLAK